MKDLRTWIILGAITVVLIVAQVMQPRAVNWTESYDRARTEPFGTKLTTQYVKENIATRMVYNPAIAWRAIRDSTFPSPKNAAWVMITDSFRPDSLSLATILDFANSGGTVFIAAEMMSDNVVSALDTFELSWTGQSGRLRLVNPAFGTSGGYSGAPRDGVAERCFQHYGSSWTVLAENMDDNAVMLRGTMGYGTVILSSTPLMFTNYGFVDDSLTPFVIGALSYLPQSVIIWDDYVRPVRAESVGLLHLTNGRPGLRWAWYMLLTAGVLYVVVYARRRQRPIPILQTIENTSAEFVRTVGRLYFARRDNLNLANKMIRLFRDNVHQRLRLRTDVPNEQLAGQISSASGAPLDLVNDVLREISAIEQTDEPLSDDGLQRLHTILEKYHHKATL